MRISVLALLVVLSACVTGALSPRATSTGTRFRDCRGCPEMVVVPAGRFVMGSPATESGRDPDEGPQRAVAFARPFAVGRLAVTRGEYAAFARATRRPDGDACYTDVGHAGAWRSDPGVSWRVPGFAQTPRDPVVCVNRVDIDAYIAWLNARTRGGYRLLTEAEFEYAARAGSAGRYPWGDTATHEQANLGRDPCCTGEARGRDRWIHTSRGGAFGANAFGLSDMQGNVWEFTADCYTPSLDAVPADGGAVLGGPCAKRVVRGAGWDDPPGYLRSANRYAQSPDIRASVAGFRVARRID